MVKPGQSRLSEQGATDPEIYAFVEEILSGVDEPKPMRWIVEQIRIRYDRSIPTRRAAMLLTSNVSWINKVRNSATGTRWLYSINYNTLNDKPLYSSYLPSVNKVGRPRHDHMLSKLHPQVIWNREGAVDGE